ncbi:MULTISPECIES: hypothetical protein [Photorhabdus]|uniref:Uncharacterized protein n=1 Tax=Photorhabdus khanii subsp. guanajuatensis TaxID=2100166 RepID=A0A4R4IWE8_9GAMM|nr:hypothetical protein [Photorhabdus khanii]TDB45244.1 hypothetical protein C5467_22245 [Photorhabdus khanii subsp. guanajuatensis]
MATKHDNTIKIDLLDLIIEARDIGRACYILASLISKDDDLYPLINQILRLVHFRTEKVYAKTIVSDLEV